MYAMVQKTDLDQKDRSDEIIVELLVEKLRKKLCGMCRDLLRLCIF